MYIKKITDTVKKDCFHQVVKALKRLTLNINFKKI
jgi:hypothetical protein